MGLHGSTVEQQIWNYFINKGLNNYGVAGLMGNLYAESGLKSTNLQNTYEKKFGLSDAAYTSAVDNGTYSNFINDSAGYGLAQWTYWSRKQNLINYAKSCNKSIGDLEMQLAFLYKELSESYKNVLSVLKSASSTLEASNIVLLQFERPANQSESVQNKRAEYGQTFYDKFVEVEVQDNSCSSAAEYLIKIAKAEIGYLEKETNSQLDDKTANAGDNNWTKYARDLAKLGVYNGNKNGYAWCDVFVDWCFISAFGVELAWKMTNQPMGGCGAGCTYSAQYYKSMNRFSTNNPQVGDQIFFNDSNGGYAHTGIVEKIADGYVYTIEGNTSSASGVIANGGSVNSKRYLMNYNKIGGYGHPNWSLVENKFKEDTVVETTKKDNIPDSWAKEAIEWAVNNKLLLGDENGNYKLHDYCTRQEMLIFLNRLYKLVK